MLVSGRVFGRIASFLCGNGILDLIVWWSFGSVCFLFKISELREQFLGNFFGRCMKSTQENAGTTAFLLAELKKQSVFKNTKK